MTEETLALCLGLFSALTLAMTNLLVKSSTDVMMGRVAFSLCAAAIMVPFAFFVPFPNKAVWGVLAISIPIHWFYQASWIRAMHRGDLSLVFPVMRGLAPLLVGIGALVVLDESLSPLSWLGLVITVLAVCSFGFLRGVRTGASGKLSRDALFWAAMTALGVMAYTISDARGVRMADNAFTFIVWLFLFDCIGVTLAAVFIRRGRFWSQLRPVLPKGIVSSICGVTSFGALLYAYTLAEAARVTAMRETAVVIAAFLGWLVLKEGMGPRRLIASFVLVLGLVLMEVGAR